MNKRIGDMTRDELMDYIIELDEENGRYERKLDKLQSNWNSLREWLESQKEDTEKCIDWRKRNYQNYCEYERDIKRFDFVLDKMNELEGVDNEDN